MNFGKLVISVTATIGIALVGVVSLLQSDAKATEVATPSAPSVSVSAVPAAVTAPATTVELVKLPACEDTTDEGASCVLFDEGAWFILETPSSTPQGVRLCRDDSDSQCLSPGPNSQGTFNLFIN